MARQTKRKQAEPTTFPILKTVEQMSKISGIGENRLRQLMDNGELEYIQNSNLPSTHRRGHLGLV